MTGSSAVDEDACVGCQPALRRGIVREDPATAMMALSGTTTRWPMAVTTTRCAQEDVQGLVLYGNFKVAERHAGFSSSGNRTKQRMKGAPGTSTRAVRELGECSPGGSGASDHAGIRGRRQRTRRRCAAMADQGE